MFLFLWHDALPTTMEINILEGRKKFIYKKMNIEWIKKIRYFSTKSTNWFISRGVKVKIFIQRLMMCQENLFRLFFHSIHSRKIYLNDMEMKWNNFSLSSKLNNSIRQWLPLWWNTSQHMNETSNTLMKITIIIRLNALNGLGFVSIFHLRTLST